MSMFELICVTNRTLCCEELPTRIAALCAAGIDKIILREKDLSENPEKKSQACSKDHYALSGPGSCNFYYAGQRECDLCML